MYFSCDVGKQLNRTNGLLDIRNYDYDDLFGTTVVNRSSKDPRREQRPASGPIGGTAGPSGADPTALRTDPGKVLLSQSIRYSA